MTRLRFLIGLCLSFSILCLQLAPAGAQGSIIRTIAVPLASRVEVNSLLGRLYLGGVNTLSVMDTSTFQTVATLPNAPFNYSALDQKLAKLYIVNIDDGSLRVLNCVNNTWLPALMNSGAFHVTVHPTDNRVFASSGTSVKVFDGVTGASITTIEFGAGNGTERMAVNPVTNLLYVQVPDTVKVVELSTYNIIGDFPDLGDWNHMVVNPLTNQLYIEDWEGGADYVVKIDLNANTLESRRTYNTEIHHIAINPLNNHLYLVGDNNTPAPTTGNLVVVDMMTNEPVDTEVFGSVFVGVTADPLTSQVYALAKSQQFDGSGGDRLIVFQDAGENFNQSPTRNFWLVPPTLTWNPVSGATGYEIQVDNNPTFTSPEYQNHALGPTDLQVTTPELPDGLYSWRVRAKRADGTWGGWSAVEMMVVDD